MKSNFDVGRNLKPLISTVSDFSRSNSSSLYNKFDLKGTSFSHIFFIFVCLPIMTNLSLIIRDVYDAHEVILVLFEGVRVEEVHHDLGNEGDRD